MTIHTGLTKAPQGWRYEREGDIVYVRHFHSGIEDHKSSMNLARARDHYRVQRRNGFEEDCPRNLRPGIRCVCPDCL